ncbi:YfhO family protein [Planococcus glaciei]|uniref:YfhO family protein n=1 Tax=Planococcus glaciei TaxID=459472 RepID=UPI001C736C19|nr:YfhO family protein [Planococcus glaciei]MBX0316843.1 YfhO family protein [Planococcus glaciei]
MNNGNNKIGANILTYFLLLFAAISMHFYFIESGTYFNENCCDSVKQMSHFYPFLQEEFSEGNFFWSWSNGLGGDLLGGFSYYYSTSPLFWLTMLFPAMEGLADVFEYRLYISIAKLFLAMVAMYHLMHYMKLLRVSSIVSALIYGGSVFFMFNSLRYDFMVDGMIYLPLLILAYEYMVEKKKNWVFITAVFLMASANFYLAFINSLFLCMYVLQNYFLSEERTLKGFLTHMIRFTTAYLAGLLLSFFAFLPAVYAFLNVDRFYYEAAIPALFDAEFYKELFYQLFFMSSESVDFIVTFPIVVFLLVPLGFLLKDKHNKKRFWFTGLFSLLILIPFSYSLFNGLSAMQYRWLYLFIFVVAWITAFIIDDLIKGKIKKVPIWFLPVLLVLLMGMLKIKAELIDSFVNNRDVGLLILAIALAGLLIALAKLPSGKRKDFIIVLLIIGLLGNSVFMNTEMLRGFLNDPVVLKEQQLELLENYATAEDQKMIDEIQQKDESFYRIMWNFLREPNAPLVHHYNGFSAYNSLMAGNIHQMMKTDYNVLHWNSPSLFQNLDNRLFLETALANKYYIRPHETIFKPYGYSLIESTDSYEVYKNDYALPVGFLYEEMITEEQFEKLSYAERDQLLLQAAVVEEEQSIHLDNYDIKNLTVEKKLYDISEVKFSNATSSNDNTIEANEGARLTVENPWGFEAGEVMLELEIRETSKKPFKVTSAFKVFTNNGDGAVYNYPRDKIVINGGHQLENNEFHINLEPGRYEISELMLTFNPYESYPEMVKSRQDRSLKNIAYTGRSIKGDIETDKDSLLFMSVPFSPGWTAKVDGEKVEPLEINSAFLGIPVTKGNHEIEIIYTTPYFKMGMMISMVTLFVLVVLSFIRRMKVKNSSP